ncbi:MAG TPA: N-acetylmuramoyl-L-alanine amidase [Vicinamibacterales bacterium]|nr:N-acetylmuramoyl-L-alanine amidase [Vicinamibacterales bacterium]
MLRRTALAVFSLALLAFVVSSSVFSQQSGLTVLSKDKTGDLVRRTLPTSVVNQQEYVALDDLAAMFQLGVREETLGMLAVTYKGKTILLTPDQALGSVAGRVFSLPAPTLRVGPRRWLVPVDFIARALAPVYDTRVTLRRTSQLVIVGDLRVPRVQVRYESSPGAAQARLTIDATPRTTSTIGRDGDQLVVQFDADAIDASNVATALQGVTAQSLIQSVRAIDPATLSFTVGARFGAFTLTTQPSDTSMRQTIDISAAVPGQTPGIVPTAPAPAAPLPPPELSTLSPSAFTPSIRTIAIDPGHGGDDNGVAGAGGTLEKDVTLAVARKLKAAFEQKLGVRVLLTREDDRNVPIADRTAVANNGKADLFVSLHADASWRPALSGAIVWTAAFGPHAQATGGLSPEMIPAFGGANRNIQFVPWDVAQIPHLEQSSALARVVTDAFQNHVPLAPNPIASAPLRVLEPANMPAVLVEMGFLTNAEQEQQLAGADFQTTLVSALVDAVVRFRDAMDDQRRATTPAGPLPGGPR